MGYAYFGFFLKIYFCIIAATYNDDKRASVPASFLSHNAFFFFSLKPKTEVMSGLTRNCLRILNIVSKYRHKCLENVEVSTSCIFLLLLG